MDKHATLDSKEVVKSPQEFISQILRQIKSTQKQINRKVSAILSKIEDFIFKTPVKLSESQVQALISGTDESDYKGLLSLCGLKHRIRQGMKKSALTAVKLTLKLLEESRQKDLFLSVFCDLDDEEFKMLKLANHILNDKSNDLSPLNLAYIIHDHRPHLSVSVYIQSKKAQERFLEWEKDEKVKRTAEKAKNLEWKEEEGKDVKKLQRRQSFEKIEQRKFKKKSTNVLLDNTVARNIDFYLNTFIDPLEMTEESMTEKVSSNVKSRQSLTKKTKIKKLLVTKARKSEIPKKIKNEEDFEKIIEKIHIDSPNFDPYVLLSTLYNDTPISYFTKVCQKLERDKVESLSLNKSLIYYNVYEYLSLEKNINAIQLEHIKKESRNDQGYTLELKNSVQGLQITLSTFADPLLKKKSQIDQIRIVLGLMGKYGFLLEIPQKLRSYLLQKDPKSFARIYQKNSLYLKNFTKLPILSKITEEVAQVISNMQNTLLEMISLKSKKFDNINDIIQILFSLNFSTNPLEFLIEHLVLKLFNRVEKIFSQQIFEVKNYNKDNIQNRKTIMRKSLSTNNVSEENFEKNFEELFVEEGDLLKKFVSLNLNVEDSNSSYNSRKLEEFSGELLSQLENLLTLAKNYKDGNYDFNFKELDANIFRDIEENRESFVANTINSAFNGVLGFMKEFLSRMATYKGKEENSKKKFRHLKGDLKIFGKIIHNLEKLLEKFSFQNVEIKPLKEAGILFFFQIATENLIENVLSEIKYENNISLMSDFFSRLYSPFMIVIFDAVLAEIKDLQNFQVFDEINQSNIQMLLGSLSSIIKSLISILKNKLLPLQNESIPLILLTNLKFLQLHLIHDLINELFNELSVGKDINPVVVKDMILKSITLIIEENVLELKKIYSERKIEKIFFWTLENIVSEEVVGDEKFQVAVFSNDKKKIEDYKLFRTNFSKEICALNAYNSYIFAIKDFEDKEIRYYMLDILNEFVVISNEILEKAPVFMDELMKNLVIFVTVVFLKPLRLLTSLNLERIKQIWLEIEFFQNMTSKFQTQISIQNCNEIFLHLKRISKGIKEKEAALEQIKAIEIFSETDLPLKQRSIRNNKYKFQHNFQFLFLKKAEA